MSTGRFRQAETCKHKERNRVWSEGTAGGVCTSRNLNTHTTTYICFYTTTNL